MRLKSFLFQEPFFKRFESNQTFQSLTSNPEFPFTVFQSNPVPMTLFFTFILMFLLKTSICVYIKNKKFPFQCQLRAQQTIFYLKRVSINAECEFEIESENVRLVKNHGA